MEDLLEGIGTCAGKLVKMDAEGLARENDLPVIVSNMIMLGAMFGAYTMIPISLETIKRVIAEYVPKKFLDDNVKAFDIGYNKARSG